MAYFKVVTPGGTEENYVTSLSGELFSEPRLKSRVFKIQPLNCDCCTHTFCNSMLSLLSLLPHWYGCSFTVDTSLL
jgi:hypothetical protein